MNISMRKPWLALALLAAAGVSPAQAADPVPPDQVVKETTARLQSEIGAREQEFKSNPKKLYAYVDDVIVPKFDTRYIAQLILARPWKRASEQQRARFDVAFHD